MAMSAAERKRKQREREREEAKEAVLNPKADATAFYLRRPFNEFYAENYGGVFPEELDAVGIVLHGDLADPELKFDWGSGWTRDMLADELFTPLGRATAMAQIFIQAGKELSELINGYKLAEIDARLAEIERTDLSDPEAKKQALADVARLTLLRQRLDKEVRHSFREIAVKGE